MKCDKKTMLLYAVTDRAWTGKQSLYEQVEAALKGGVTCVQLREKELDEDEFLSEAIEISALCKQYDVPFFINDNVDIAIKCKADGIHVGQEDMIASQVREKVGEKMMIGVSVHSVEEALEAVKDVKSEDIYVIGGGEIYKQMLPYCDLAHVTKIDYAYQADTYFPNLDELEDWELTGISEEQTYYDLVYEFCRYERKK
jgi:thiamine-phosphate diphosphorylase